MSPLETGVIHHSVDLSPGVRLHYLDAGRGPSTAVFLHGFPQTSAAWTKIIPRMTPHGYRAICPDYRGAGWSSKPAAGYDKVTMAGDIRTLVREHAKVVGKFALIGHDIGAMVAIAYALKYRDDLSHLVLIDAPLTGTSMLDSMRGDPRGWHVAFHSARDIAELLVQGRERPYLQHMFGVRVYDPSVLEGELFESYVRAYEAPGAMRAGFELYRAFDEDDASAKKAVASDGKLTIPVMTVGGATTALARFMPGAVCELAERHEHVSVPRSGHWVPEENPEFLSEAILKFLSRNS